MKRLFTLQILCLLVSVGFTQPTYFPPIEGSWETIHPQTLGWNEAALNDLYTYLEAEQTKAFIVLVDGKIVAERYFGRFTADSLWYWASAGKSLTAFTLGVAFQEKNRHLDEKTSAFLGTGWSSLTREQENKITVWNQLTMTTGLDDGVADSDCTTPDCFRYKADAGSRWAYHNGPYTILDKVIESATGQTLGLYSFNTVRNPIGMVGLFYKSGSNNVFASNARSMARFGLLVLNRGNWNGTAILKDTAYFRRMTNTSQELNPSYGYLWWLNGKSHVMVPGLQTRFAASLASNAPHDMIAALGKNGQIINVVPSKRMVFIRMGNSPVSNPVPFQLNNEIWRRLNTVMETATKTEQTKPEKQSPLFSLYPNPAGKTRVHIEPSLPQSFSVTVYAITGQQICRVNGNTRQLLPNLAPGRYLIEFIQANRTEKKILIVH